MKKIIIVLLIIVLPVISIFGAGQKDLTKKPPGYGILVVGNEGKLTAPDGIRWIYEIVYENVIDGKEYSINIPDLHKKIDFYYLPPGEYIARKEIPHHYSGSEFINTDECFFNNYEEIHYGFTISEGQITLFNYNLYKFNNKKVPGKELESDVNDYVYPDSFIKKYGNRRYLYRWDYNDVTIQYLFFLPISKSVEKEILLSLTKIKGAEQWQYSPKYAANNDIWPNIPVKAAEAEKKTDVDKVTDIPEWIVPCFIPKGNLYVLSMEIDLFNNDFLNLESAGKSSASFISYIKNNEKKNYKNIIINNVDKRELTGKEIVKKISDVCRNVTEKDRLIIYLSSQGISDILGRPYIFPSDGNIDNIPGSCLPLKELFLEIDSRGPAVIFMDTGKNGKWIKDNEAYFSYESEKLKESISSLDINMGVYFSHNGSFRDRGSDLLVDNVWQSGFKGIGEYLFVPTAEYKNFAVEEQAAVQYREDVIIRLTDFMKSRKKEDALAVLKEDQTVKYLSADYIDELRKSIDKYFN